MKKSFLFVFIFIFFITMNHNIVNAQDNVVLQSGCTPEGVYYEVYGEVPDIPSHLKSTYVERKVTYSSIVVPNSELDWTENIDGKTYSGTLLLASYRYTNGKTYATYVGYLDY